MSQDTERKLRIAVLGSSYPRSDEDPAVPWLREIVNRTAALGHEVTVLAPSFEGLGTHRIDEIKVRRWRYSPAPWENLTHDQGAPNKIHNPIAKLRAIPYILMGMIMVFYWSLRDRYDVIHCHWPFPHGFMSWLPQKILGIKVVAMCHGAELALGRKSGLIAKVLGMILESMDEVCTNSSHTAKEVAAVSSRQAVVLPYGATVQAPDMSEAQISDPPLLLNCGRLIQRKGLHVLLQALPKVLEQQPVQVVITGEGDCKVQWQKLSAELGLEEVVEFAGFVSSERLAQLYRDCTCYVHPAIFDDNGDTEGLGVVLIEALAHKKPVIASGVGGIVDVIKDGETGILVPEKDEEALVEAILEVLNDPERAKQLGEQGYRYAEEVFDWDRIVKDTEAVYRKALNQAA